MSQSTNWGALYTQGRCKAFGVPWSDEEAHAVFILKIPADAVRQGCLTLEDYEQAKTKQHSQPLLGVLFFLEECFSISGPMHEGFHLF